MMNFKRIYVVISLIGLFGCEQIEKIDSMMDADSTDIANEIADLKGASGTIERLATEAGSAELLFRASGTEPGWLAEYYTNKFRLLVDYGKDSIIFSKEFERGGDYDLSYSFNENSNAVKLSVKIEDKACTDAAGNKKEKMVTVTLNDKVYTGCGEDIKN